MLHSIQHFVPPEPLRLASWQLVPQPKTDNVSQGKKPSMYPTIFTFQMKG